MLINPETNNTIWYYQATEVQIYSIFQYGLKANPEIDLFTKLDKSIILKVDVKDIDEELVNRIDNQLKIFTDISPEYISLN